MTVSSNYPQICWNRGVYFYECYNANVGPGQAFKLTVEAGEKANKDHYLAFVNGERVVVGRTKRWATAQEARDAAEVACVTIITQLYNQVCLQPVQ